MTPPRPPRWTFGLEPLPETLALASALRRLTSTVLSLEAPDDDVRALTAEIDRVQLLLAGRAPADPAPRLGTNPAPERRVYLDHSRDIGAFNPFFPEYEIVVEGDRAAGTVEFPLCFEGPPGIVHGGFLAVFFDCAVQHHNSDLGATGKTTSLTVRYRKPTPLLTKLRFEISRSAEDRRINSTAFLLLDDVTLCEADMSAVAADRTALPVVAERRLPS
jgi:acyl-coenzyme A thioesterase PaaI-like protein